MDVKLFQDEKVVKSWDYGVYKRWFRVRGKFTLVVTNKRVISLYEGKTDSSREDYYLCNIQNVSVNYAFKRHFFFFKRGSLEVSFATDVFDDVSVVGLSAITNKPSLLQRIPLIGRFFAGKKAKVKVDVNAAKDVVLNLSTLVMERNALAK